MKKLLFLLLWFPLFANSQITYFASVGVPTDNGTSAASPVAFANPPIASMTTGDLVVVYCYARNASATFGVSNAGGQSWNSGTAHNSSTATLSGQVFWCRYNGTWSAAPSFTFSSTTNTNAIMHVFRPTSTTLQWGLETGLTGSGAAAVQTLASYSASGNFAVPEAGSATINTHANTIAFAIWSSDDDNSWGTIIGTGWTQVTVPVSQWRNTSGSDASSAYSYKIYSATGTLNQVQASQTVNGSDPGIKGIYLFYEYTANTRNANSDFFKLFNRK